MIPESTNKCETAIEILKLILKGVTKKEEKEDIENAIRILKLTKKDGELVAKFGTRSNIKSF